MSSERRIFRHEVPVDDQEHEVVISGDPLAVSCRDLTKVEFWSLDDPNAQALLRRFTVVGTGQLLSPYVCRHWGTAIAPGGQLVWHLMECES